MKTSDKAKNALEKATEIRKEVAGLPALTAYLRDIIEETVRMEGDLLALRKAMYAINQNLDIYWNGNKADHIVKAINSVQKTSAILLQKTAHYEQ